jgi:signal transduction histidine kinase
MLLAVLAVHGGALLLYRRSAVAAADEAFARQVANQLSLAREAMIRRPSPERDAEAAALSSPHFEIGWSDAGPPSPGSATDPALAAFRDRMAAIEPSLGPGFVLGMQGGDDPLHQRDLVGGFRLPDGSFLTFRSAHAPSLARVGPWAYLSTAMAILVGVATVVLMHWIAKPLRDLARRTGEIGYGPPVAIPEVGPDETRGIARALNAMQARIHAGVSERTQALAAVSHDLRTPIARLRLRLDATTETTERTAMAADLDDMQAMVDSTLAYLRGDADPEPRRVTNVASVLMGIADASADAGRDVAYRGPGRALANVRPVAFRRALENLVDNGVRYGARVRISLEGEEAALVVRVDDGGPGIAPEDVARAFEPFTRLEGSRNRNTGGTGLGLTIAKRSIEADGGALCLGNRPQGGLRAEVRLPKPVPADTLRHEPGAVETNGSAISVSDAADAAPDTETHR